MSSRSRRSPKPIASFTYSQLGENGTETTRQPKKSCKRDSQAISAPAQAAPESAPAFLEPKRPRLDATAPKPSDVSELVAQYYLTCTESLFKAVSPKSDRVNYKTAPLHRFPRWAFQGVAYEFSTLDLKAKGKDRSQQNRKVARVESEASESLELWSDGATPGVREIDGARGQQHFDKLAAWCAFQNFTRGRSGTKRYKFGWEKS